MEGEVVLMVFDKECGCFVPVRESPNRREKNQRFKIRCKAMLTPSIFGNEVIGAIRRNEKRGISCTFGNVLKEATMRVKEGANGD